MFIRHVLPYLLIASAMLAACAAPSGAAPTDAPASTNQAAPTAQAVATSAAAPTTATTGTKQNQWDAPPPMTIDPAKLYLATFKVAQGDIQVQLFADKAPITVNNFIFLAQAGYYDGTTFHRVLADFMAQGGDPTGTGSGGPGYQFEDEFHPDLTFAEAGLLAMANSGPGTNGSQFFITFAPTPHLDFRHTIFGKVVEGFEVLKAISLRDPGQNPSTPGDTLLSVTIDEIPQSLLPEPTPTPEPNAPVMEAGRPLAALEPAARANLFNTAPALVIDPAKTYVATIETSQGDITVELYPADAPQSVNNFYVLASLGYWDNFPITFVQADVFVLTGSPAGDPSSDVGYSVPAEIKRPNVEGAVGMWLSVNQTSSSGSQFYLMLVADPRLDAQFTVFGQITEGLEVAKALTQTDTIEKVTVTEK